MTYRAGDLKDLVDPIFEIDSYQSKMGEDQDIVVVSFTVEEINAAKDLVDFVEKGYDFVLDADSTPGEIDNGRYKVFVEMERNRNVSRNVLELLDGVGKISQLENFRFRYHKKFKSYDATEHNLSENIPVDTGSYLAAISESRLDNYKDFFNKSYLESTELLGNILYIKKSFADPVAFKLKDFNDTNTVNESIKQKINMNDYAEILFLTKYIGDYNIMKFGHKTLTFENEGHTLVVERI
jgi:hypothetical protein